MKLYLDNSFLNRPFDDPNISLHRLESEILLFTLETIKSGMDTLVNSAVIEYENSLNPFPERKIFVAEVLKLAKVYQNVNERIKIEAAVMKNRAGLAAIDALHLTVAWAARVDYFVTCDYTVLKRYRGELRVVTPLKFIKCHEEHKR